MTRPMVMPTVLMEKHTLPVIMKAHTARHIQAAIQTVSVMDMCHQMVSAEKHARLNKMFFCYYVVYVTFVT